MKILATVLLLFPLTLIAQKKVGINTTNPVYPFQVNVDSTFSNFILDQEHVIMDGELAITPGSEMVTQGITIGQSGKLARVQITLGVADVDEMLVEVYLGPGPLGGWLGTTTVFDVSGPGTYEIEFDQPWPDVTAGQQLNFLLSPVTGTALNLSRSLGDTYSGGQAYFWNGSWSALGYDLTFRTYVAQPDTASIDVLSVQQDGRVRIKNYVLPESDGAEGQVMATDGAGMLMWSNPDTSSSQSEILDDDGDTRIKVEASPDEDIIRFNTAGSEKMNILSNGNVGMGISEPLAKLHVGHNSTTTSSQLRLTETSVADFARIKFDNENDPGIFWDVAALAHPTASVSKINFYYSNPGFTGDKMTITGEGNIGIGTTSPGNRLRVNGSASSSQHILSAGVNYSGNVNIRAVEGFSTPATGYGIGGYFFGGYRGIQSFGNGGSATGLTIAVEGSASGTAGTRTGIFGRATGGTTNWAGYFAEGNVMAENNLYVTGSVGIGTSNPGNKLRVNGSASSSQHVFSAATYYSGNAQIRAVEGFSTPATGYGIGGYFFGGSRGIQAFGNGGSATGLTIAVEGSASGTAGTRTGIFGRATGGTTNWAGYFAEGNVYVTNQLRIGSAAQGGVPGYKLMVDGKVIAEEVRVQLSSDWPDYVFDEKYDLPSLAEVKLHIQQNKHLPGIPSASEVIQNGLYLGDMQIKMMEKIEEMMMYILQQDQRIEALEEKLSVLQRIADEGQVMTAPTQNPK